jgi:hypothetical protein
MLAGGHRSSAHQILSLTTLQATVNLPTLTVFVHALKRIDLSIGLVGAVATTVLTACGSKNPDYPREKSCGHFLSERPDSIYTIFRKF